MGRVVTFRHSVQAVAAARYRLKRVADCRGLRRLRGTPPHPKTRTQKTQPRRRSRLPEKSPLRDRGGGPGLSRQTARSDLSGWLPVVHSESPSSMDQVGLWAACSRRLWMRRLRMALRCPRRAAPVACHQRRGLSRRKDLPPAQPRSSVQSKETGE